MPVFAPTSSQAQPTAPQPFSRPGSPKPNPDESHSPNPKSTPSECRPAYPTVVQPHYQNPFGHTPSEAAQEWEDRRQRCGETNDAIDELMRLEGLEEVKKKFLEIKAKADICVEQGGDLKHERFNIVFQGNPGTGKTTIARLYAKLLHSIKVVGSDHVEETSGAKLCTGGPGSASHMLDHLLDHKDGGVLFVDEAYQLTAAYTGDVGQQVLDLILTAMENHIGKLACIFVGYKDEMESFYEHNPGLSSRIPELITFADFTDAELWKILCDNIHTRRKGKMKVEDGIDGLYMRVAVRRLGYARTTRGFGNARAVENLLDRNLSRQAQRIERERRQGKRADLLLLTKEDMIGPDPMQAAVQSPAWTELQKLIGLESVKKSVRGMLGMIQRNYRRELAEEKPRQPSLSRLFVGAPGTGKTTVAKFYGQILADIGLLTRGDVILKTPADFIGNCLGKSEAKTKKILEMTVGKVLVIDEAYMLDAGDANKDQDKFKTGVIDTLVSMVQGVPGEDRCIILVGYEDKIRDMFRNVNPGLSRRFPIAEAFRFENFDLAQLKDIMQKKMGEQDIEATPEALDTASDVLERALMRPIFTNAGEVDSVLAAAVMRYEIRQSAKLADEQAFNGRLEPQDFDEDYARDSRAGVNSRRELEGLVHETIIEKLSRYQVRCLAARRHGLKPKDQVPTNFVFKGNPGTGKTTIAQHMGKVFYDMGFLATPDVIESSTTDLIAQYTGRTSPKTLKVLEMALGKVLVIDDAHRLSGGQYAIEAVDEIIQFLTKPSHAGRMVVILAGYREAMDALMTMWPVLSGLFSEEVVFDDLRLEECITLLVNELGRSQIVTEGGFLLDPSNADYARVRRLFHALQEMPSWANARDVKSLAKQMLGKFLESSGQEVQSVRMVTVDQVLQCLIELMTQRRDRSLAPTARANAALPAQQPNGGDSVQALAAPQLAPPPPAAETSICAVGASRTVTRNTGSASRSQSRTQAQPHGHQAPQKQNEYEIRITQLEQAPAAAEGTLASGMDGEAHSLSVKDILRDSQSALRELTQNENLQQRLRDMNRCENGYSWIQELAGWRCEGGNHLIYNREVRAMLRE